MCNNYENMEPANEALGILKTVLDTMEKKCEMIKAELNEAKTVKEQIIIIEKLKNELGRFRLTIQKTKPNFFDSRCYKRLMYIVGSVVSTVLIPFTFGVSLIGTVGCIAMAVETPTPDVIKADTIKSIDNQMKNCDMIIKYLKENKESVAEEGVLQDFIDNKKHNHEIRKEARQVRNEYKAFKKTEAYRSGKDRKFGELNEKVTHSELSKKYPTQVKQLMKIANALKTELDSDLKGTGIKADISLVGLSYNSKYLSVTVSVDPNEMDRKYSEMDGYEFDKLYSSLNTTTAFFRKKYKNTDYQISIEPDEFMVVYVDTRIPDDNSFAVESFIVFCDNYQE